MNSILVVDDDDVFRNRLIKAFQERGLNSLSAANLELTLTPSKSLPSAPAPHLQEPSGNTYKEFYLTAQAI